MTAAEIKQVVAEVLAEQKVLAAGNVDEVVMRTIASILTSFGMDEEDRQELKADFQHLRKWRRSVEQAQSYTFKLVVTTIVGGFIGAFWLGFKTIMGK